MILASSALLAVLSGADEAEVIVSLIQGSTACRLSIANYVELSLVIEARLGPEGTRHADNFVRRAAIGLEPVSVEQGRIARQAFFDFGGDRHPAALNFGDCFAYALSKAFNEPLLFIGGGLAHTDVAIAHPLVGNEQP